MVVGLSGQTLEYAQLSVAEALKIVPGFAIIPHRVVRAPPVQAQLKKVFHVLKNHVVTQFFSSSGPIKLFSCRFMLESNKFLFRDQMK